jgi:hypothetical protein
MSNVFQVNSSHFTVVGRELRTTIPGTVIVLFKVNGSPFVAHFEPIFVNQAARDPRFQYCVYNASLDPTTPRESAGTKSPIKEFPAVLMFNNQWCVAVIRKRTPEEFAQSINEIEERIHQMEGGGSAVPVYGTPTASTPSAFGDPGRRPHPGKAPAQGKIHKPQMDGTPSGRGEDNSAGDDSMELFVSTKVIPYNKPWVSDALHD